jgi:hypothetical protein
MMLRRPWKATLCIAGLAMAMLAPMAAAQVPPAADRAPADAHIVGVIKNLERFSGQVRGLAERLRLPEDAISQLGEMNRMLAMPGLNAAGSAAFVVLPGEDEDDQRMVMILPVNDLQAMVRELGGEPGPGVNEVEIEGNTMYLKNIDGGFVVAGDDHDAVEAFQPASGSAQRFQQMLGQSGRSLAERSEMYFIANIPAMAPRLRQGLQRGMEQAEMMAMMAGGAQQPNLQAIQAFADDFLNEAQSAVLGLNIAEAGLSMGMAAQFKEGTQMAGYFREKGNASRLLNALPNQPYLVALAIDSSKPGVKQFFQRLSTMNPDSAPGMGPIQIAELVERTDGIGFFWGTTPALMGGLFLNTVAYYSTSDPAGLIQQTRQAMERLNRQTINDITFTTSYNENAERVGDRQVDTWSMRMQADPTKPGGQQMAQMQMMIFGHSGPGGYMARLDNGVVMTYSKNKNLLEQSIAAARNDNEGLSQEAGIRAVATNLPEGTTAAGYIGIRNILELAIGFMGMMGGGPAVDVPENMPPIGFGLVTDAGGAHGQLFIPMAVMEAIRDMADSMGGGEDDFDFDDDDAGQDEF